jgi:hypothetical protein
METDYDQFEANELKTDAKIDMLHQSGLFGSPNKANRRVIVEDDISEEEGDVEMSLVTDLTVHQPNQPLNLPCRSNTAKMTPIPKLKTMLTPYHCPL